MRGSRGGGGRGSRRGGRGSRGGGRGRGGKKRGAASGANGTASSSSSRAPKRRRSTPEGGSSSASDVDGEQDEEVWHNAEECLVCAAVTQWYSSLSRSLCCSCWCCERGDVLCRITMPLQCCHQRCLVIVDGVKSPDSPCEAGSSSESDVDVDQA